MVSKNEEMAVREGFQLVALRDAQYDAVIERLERIEVSVAELKDTLNKLLQHAERQSAN
jgi:uncharacterized protein (UPF0335 family)